MNEIACSPSHQGRPSCGLVSLLDMLKKIDLKALLSLQELQRRVGEALELEAAQVAELTRLQSNALWPDIDSSKRIGQSLATAFLLSMEGAAMNLNLRQSLELARQTKISPPKTAGEITILYRSVEIELSQNQYFRIPEDRASYWSSSQLLSENAKTAFSETYGDLRDAGTAYACGLYTASVFHSMQAIERGLRIIAAKLDVSTSGDENMKVVIDGIQAAAKAIDSLSKSSNPNKVADSQFFSEAAIHAYNIKDAWRNFVSHGKERYDENSAKNILDNTLRFYEKIAQRFNDNSLSSS